MANSDRTGPAIKPTAPPATGQRGVVLATALIFLVVLTLMGVTAMRTNITEERLAGNSRDWGMAFQAAEAALRDAEADIQSGARFVGEAGFDSDCTDGLCTVQSDGTPVWVDLASNANEGWLTGTNVGPSVAYGTHTAPTPATISGVIQQPRYIIEVITEKGSSLIQGTGYGNNPSQYVYRITARGFGASVGNDGAPVSRVTLQSMYKP